MIDQSTDFGARAAAHLRDDIVVWLTTVSDRGAPLPTPVWFIWDGAQAVRMFSLPTARRVQHIAANEHVSLNFAGDGRGGDIVVFSGHARVDEESPPASDIDAYVEKYGEQMARIGLGPEEFSRRYSVAVVIELTRLRGH